MKGKLKSALEEATKSITGEEVVDESTEKSVEAEKDVQSGKSSTDLGKHQSETSKSEDTDTDDEVADSKDKKDKDKDSAKKDVQSGKSSTDLGKHQSETSKSEDEDYDDDSDDDSEDDKSAKKDVQSGKSSTDLGKHQSETKKSVDSDDADSSQEDTDVKSIVEKSISNYFENKEANNSVDYVTADDMTDIIKSLSIAMKKSIVDVVSKSVKEAVKDITGTQTQTQAADLKAKKSKSKKEPAGETGDSGNAGSKINTNTDVEESCDAKKSIDDSGVEHVEDTKNEKPVIGKSVQGIEPEKNSEEVEKSVNSSKSVHTASDWANTTLLKSADARLFARKNGLLSNELDRSIDGINAIASKSMSGNNLEMAKKSLKDLKSLVDNTKGFEKFELLN